MNKKKLLNIFSYILCVLFLFSRFVSADTSFQLSRKLEREILNNLDDQSKTLTQYSNDMTGFKIAFKKMGNIELSTKQLDLLSSENIFSKARYNYYIGDFDKTYSLFTMLNENERTKESDALMIQSLYKIGLNQKVEQLIPLLNLNNKTENKLLREVDLLNCVDYSCSDFINKWKRYIKASKNRLNNKLYYAIGKKLFYSNKMDWADLVFSHIDKKHVNYLKGKYFKAAHFISMNDISSAIIELTGLNNLIKEFKNSERLVIRQLQGQVNLSLGRLYYEEQKYQAAIEWYNKIDRKSKIFNEALEEISWCLYKSGKGVLAGNIIEGINMSNSSGKLALDVSILKANMYINNQEPDKALVVYEEIEKVYAEMRKKVENVIENNSNMEDIINLFLNLSKGEIIGEREKILHEWLEHTDMVKFLQYANAFRDANNILLAIDRSKTLMNDIKNKLLEKRDFISSFEKIKSAPGGFEDFGRRLYEIIQDVREREIFILCLDVPEKICTELKTVSRKRYDFYKNEIIDQEQSGEAHKNFQVFQRYLNEEDNEIQKVRSKYNFNNKVLNVIDDVKTKYSKLNLEYLNVYKWIKTQLMDNYGSYREKENELVRIQKETTLIGQRLIQELFNESINIYVQILNRINHYKYNVTLGRNEITWLAKNKYTKEYLTLEQEKNKKIINLKEAFSEVFHEIK